MDSDEENYDFETDMNLAQYRKKQRDHQYDALMKEFPSKPQKKVKIEEQKKYQGKKVGKSKLNEWEDKQISDEDEESDSIFFFLSKLTEVIDIASIVSEEQEENANKMEDIDLDEMIDEINQEDEILQKNEKVNQEMIAKSKALAEQIEVWKNLLNQMNLFQKIQEQVNCLPLNQILEGFCQTDTSIRRQQKEIELCLSANLTTIHEIQNEFIQKSQMSQIEQTNMLESAKQQIVNWEINKENFEENYEIDNEQLFNELETNYETNFEWVKEELSRWCQKTNILNSNLRKSGLKNLLYTPMGQVEKAMQQNYNQLLLKTQMRLPQQKIIGKIENEFTSEYEPNIYNDYDLFSELLKDICNEIYKSNQQKGKQEWFNVKDFLKEKEMRKLEHKKKLYDPKSSKDRKFKYEIHQKLVNFMTTFENSEILEGRDEILKSITTQFSSNQQNDDKQQSDEEINQQSKKRNQAQTEAEEIQFF